MAHVPSAEEIRQVLMKTHPAEQPKVLASLIGDPIKEAKRDARSSARAAEKAGEKANALKAKIGELEVQSRAISQSLAVRQRMSPQDLRDALNGLFETYNFSPAEELVQMLADRSHPYFIDDVKTRIHVLETLNSYVMPKLKTVEHKGTVETNHTITILRIGEDGGATQIQTPQPKTLDVESEVQSG